MAADAVVHLLALSGAKVRDGLPEATPDLVRAVLLEALPRFLSVAPGDEGAALAVLRVLGDRTRADGRLNTKRHARLREAIDTCAEEHLPVMCDPRELTLPRFWGGLLRVRGVDVRDAQAVRGELEELARLPYAERAGLLSLPDATERAESDAGLLCAGPVALALRPYRRALAMERQAVAATLLGQRLALCLTESDEAPRVLDLLGSEQVARLMDADGAHEWTEAVTKAGLRVARRWSLGQAELPSAAVGSEHSQGVKRFPKSTRPGRASRLSWPTMPLPIRMAGRRPPEVPSRARRSFWRAPGGIGWPSRST